ncbi:MAG: tetratricopeptide repeat protein, partial [Atribacterota bacterium]
MLLLIKNFRKIKNDKGPSPVIFLILLSFSLLLLNGCLFAPLSKGSVEGYIHEETVINTRPLEGALISITGSSNTALTNEEGFFRIDEVYIGARNLTITKESYITYKILSVVIKEDEVTLIDNGDPIVVRAVDDKYLFDGGIIYYDSGEYTNALTTFQQLINDFPDSQYTDDAQYYIGYINEKKLGYYIQALLEYQELIDNYPNSPYTDDAQLGIGNCYYVTYDFSHAIEAYQKVIDDYPQTSLAPLAQYYIGHSYRKLFNYEQAVLEYTKVIDNYPESDYIASAQYYLAYSYFEDKDYNQAILEFQKVIAYYPASTWPGESDRLVAPLAQFYIGYCH